MIQRNKYIYLRYITNQIYTQGKSPVKPIKPTAPSISFDDPGYQSAYQQFTRENNQYTTDLAKYNEDINNQNTLSNNGQINTITEPPIQAIRLMATSINYGITIGTSTVAGLSETDLVSWYMKPITLNIKGVSIVTPNPLIDSDNIIPIMYRKLKQFLSETNYNYYQKPRFLLYIENGLQELDSFIGVIKNFIFDENADFPDKFNYSIDFEGKYAEQDILDKAVMGLQADIKTAATTTAKLTALNIVNNSRIISR